jgi:hypothetical protein
MVTLDRPFVHHPACAVSIMPDLSRTAPNPSGLYPTVSPLYPKRFGVGTGSSGVGVGSGYAQKVVTSPSEPDLGSVREG